MGNGTKLVYIRGHFCYANVRLSIHIYSGNYKHIERLTRWESLTSQRLIQIFLASDIALRVVELGLLDHISFWVLKNPMLSFLLIFAAKILSLGLCFLPKTYTIIVHILYPTNFLEEAGTNFLH